MTNRKVFVVGAAGETGGSILQALIEDGSFDITCFVRTESIDKPATHQLRGWGLNVVSGDLATANTELVSLLHNIDTVISVISPFAITEQISLVDAAVKAGVRRFLPCNWGTPAPRGVMQLRDKKEEVHDHIFRQRLGYTIIDVGFWYDISFPRVPSGRFDYAVVAPNNNTVYAGGNAPNMIIDKKDVGRITVKIIKDPRTLNKRVYVYGEVLTQVEMNAIVEDKTGEKLELDFVSASEIMQQLAEATNAANLDPSHLKNNRALLLAQYAHSKYVRVDNTPENCDFLGYMDGRSLYPDFQFVTFAGFVDELVAGKVKRPYPNLSF